MASLTIRKLDKDLHRRLRAQAARHARSMEEEAQLILAAGLAGAPRGSGSAGKAIAAIVDPIGGIELDLPPRWISRAPAK